MGESAMDLITFLFGKYGVTQKYEDFEKKEKQSQSIWQRFIFALRVSSFEEFEKEQTQMVQRFITENEGELPKELVVRIKKHLAM